MAKNIVTFDYERCKGCNLCVLHCPKNILYQDKKTINESGYQVIKITDMDDCIGCAFCAIMCPDSVIKVEVDKS